MARRIYMVKHHGWFKWAVFYRFDDNRKDDNFACCWIAYGRPVWSEIMALRIAEACQLAYNAGLKNDT